LVFDGLYEIFYATIWGHAENIAALYKISRTSRTKLGC